VSSAKAVETHANTGMRAAPAGDPASSRAFTGAALLALAAAAVASAIGLSSIDAGQFAIRNVASPEDQKRLLWSALAAACAVGASAALVAWRWASAREAIARWGLRLSPLALVYAAPILASYLEWSARPLPFLALLAIATLLLERSVRAALATGTEASRAIAQHLTERIPVVVQRYGPAAVVLCAATAYAVYTGYYSIENHRRFGTAAFDLGIYDNLLYNALHGHPFRSPVLFGPNGGNYIAGHAELIMLAYVPFYALWPRAETLLVMQSVLLGFAAFPLYKFARTQVPRSIAVVVALAYLMYAPLHGPNFYDFHWLPTAIFFHFWLYYALATSRLRLAFTCIAVLLLTREDVSVGLVVLGVFLALTGIHVRLGIGLAVTAVCYFVIIRFGVMAWAGKWWFADLYKDLIPRGEKGYVGIIRTVVTNPAYFLGTLLTQKKLIYLLHLFVPVAFLPWRKAALAWLASAGFFFTLMTTGYAPTLSIAFQYTTHWIPYVFAATVLSLRLLARDAARQRAAAAAMAFAVTFHGLVFGALLQRETFVAGFGRIPFAATDDERQRYANFTALAAHIPREASVAATESELPHVSNRLTAFALRDDAGGADYILLNRTGLGYVNSRRSVEAAFSRYEYALVEKRPPLYLFKRAAVTPGTSEAKAELGFR